MVAPGIGQAAVGALSRRTDNLRAADVPGGGGNRFTARDGFRATRVFIDEQQITQLRAADPTRHT